MDVEFVKMHASGNDFVFIDKSVLKKEFNSDELKLICHRNFGIGCDQLIIYDKNSSYLEVEIFNSDGTEAEMCGNAMRCLGGLTLKDKENKMVKLKTSEVLISRNKNEISVQMPKIVKNGDIINIGNKHRVFIIKDKNEIDYKENKEFNKNYVEILDKERIFVTTIERGVGETLACGSGVCASVYFVKNNGFIKSNLINVSTSGTVKSKSSDIKVEINEDLAILRGDWTFVFKGLFFEKLKIDFTKN